MNISNLVKIHVNNISMQGPITFLLNFSFLVIKSVLSILNIRCDRNLRFHLFFSVTCHFVGSSHLLTFRKRFFIELILETKLNFSYVNSLD